MEGLIVAILFLLLLIFSTDFVNAISQKICGGFWSSFHRWLTVIIILDVAILKSSLPVTIFMKFSGQVDRSLKLCIIECFGANGAISWSSPGHEIWVRVCFPFLFDHKISQRSLNRLSLNLQEWWIVIISRGFFHFFKMHFLLSVSCPATINSSFTFAKCVARMQKKIRMFLQHIKQFLYITNFLIQDIDM